MAHTIQIPGNAPGTKMSVSIPETYAIADGDGNPICGGLSEHEYRRVAQGHADRLGRTVYVYETGSAEEEIPVEPSPAVRVRGATSLEDLLALFADLDDRTATELPTFGGEEPPGGTSGVWSWDETRLLVGTCADDLRIVDRAEWRR